MSETKPTFDPSKDYEWNPEDKFELSGQEFAFFYNLINSKKVEALQTLEMFKVLENKLILAVENGIAKERILEGISSPNVDSK